MQNSNGENFMISLDFNRTKNLSNKNLHDLNCIQNQNLTTNTIFKSPLLKTIYKEDNDEKEINMKALSKQFMMIDLEYTKLNSYMMRKGNNNRKNNKFKKNSKKINLSDLYEACSDTLVSMICCHSGLR